MAIRAAVSRLLAGLGIEGAFLLSGTGLVAYGSSFLAPFAPFLVVGGMAIFAGLALAIPERRQ